MSKRTFKEAPASALGHAVVAVRQGDVKVVTTGLPDWDEASRVEGYHRREQERQPSYHEGYYFSVMSPTDYAVLLTERGEPLACRACGRPLTPA